MDLVVLQKNRIQYFEQFEINRTFGKEEWEQGVGPSDFEDEVEERAGGTTPARLSRE